MDGLRGDLVTNRAARALVAFEGRNEVTVPDIERVIGPCLNHRSVLEGKGMGVWHCGGHGGGDLVRSRGVSGLGARWPELRRVVAGCVEDRAGAKLRLPERQHPRCRSKRPTQFARK